MVSTQYAQSYRRPKLLIRNFIFIQQKYEIPIPGIAIF